MDNMTSINSLIRRNREFARSADSGLAEWEIVLKEIKRIVKKGEGFTITVDDGNGGFEYFKLNLVRLEDYLTRHGLKALEDYRKGGRDFNQGKTVDEKLLIYIRHALNQDFKNFISIKKNLLIEEGYIQKDSKGNRYDVMNSKDSSSQSAENEMTGHIPEDATVEMKWILQNKKIFGEVLEPIEWHVIYWLFYREFSPSHIADNLLGCNRDRITKIKNKALKKLKKELTQTGGN